MKDERTLKVEGCFGAHAEKKIKNAEVGQKSMTLLIDLPIGYNEPTSNPSRREGGLVSLNIRNVLDKSIQTPIPSGGVGGGLNKFHHLHDYGLIEVNKHFPIVAFEERTEVVGIIVEERTFAIGRAKCIPMLATPLAVVAETNLTGQGRMMINSDRNGKFLDAIGSSNETMVAECLLDIAFAGVDGIANGTGEIVASKKRFAL